MGLAVALGARNMLSKIVCACSIAVVCYAQQQGAGPYTAAQATAGRATYEVNCAGCHAADLSGQNSASPLAGGVFLSSWGDRVISTAFSATQASQKRRLSRRGTRSSTMQRGQK